jgi:cation-transporting ATPase E
MTGDGVNDILAMKEADVSIAIGEGSDAARRSAKLVLLDSDFKSVPSIIAEGRKSINNLERSATLFLSKTVYASLLAVFFVVLPFEYPFSPIEMSLLNFLCIGLPGLALALENNTERIKNQFVNNIKHYSVPTGLLVAVSALTISILAAVFDISRSELTALSSLVVFVIGFVLIYRISKPLNYFRSSLLMLIFFLFATSLVLPLARTLFFLP